MKTGWPLTWNTWKTLEIPWKKISPGKTLEKRPFLAKTLEIPWKKIIADLTVRDMSDFAFFQVKIFFPPSAGSVHYQALLFS